MSHTYVDDGEEDDGCHCYCDECKLRRLPPPVLGPFKPPTYREHDCKDKENIRYKFTSPGSADFILSCRVCGRGYY